MKGNKLIATSIASAMLVAGMAMPALAVDSATEVRYSEKYVSSPAIAIDLRNGESELTREELATLVSDRYHTTLVSVKNANGETITSSSARVGTGSIATLSNGKTVTVVLYGDINKDGAVDLVDAQAIYNNYHVTSLPAEQAKAAELTGDSNIDFVDAQRAFNYASPAGYTGLVADLDRLPVEEGSKLPVSDNMTLVINNGEYINRENEDSVKVQIKLKNALEKTKKYSIHLYDEKGVEITSSFPRISGKEFNITNKVVIVDPLGENVGLDFASKDLPDQKFTFTLVDEEGNVVASTVVEKHTDEKTLLADATVTRDETENSYLSCEAYGTANAKKMYYIVETSESAPDLADFDRTAEGKLPENVKELTFSDNKIENATISGLVNGEDGYYLYYILEDEYGNLSDEVGGPIFISTDTQITKATEILSVTAPKLENLTSAELNDGSAKFTWKLVDDQTGHETSADDKTFVAILYRDGVAVATEEVSDATEVAVKDLLEVDGTIAMKKAGKYTLKVVTKAASTSETDSEPAYSNMVEVKKLNKVSNITFTVKENGTTTGTDVLTWNSNYTKKDIAGFNFRFVKVANDGTETKDTSVTATYTNNGSNQVTVTGLTPNVVYKVYITTDAKDNLAVVDSDEQESAGFLKLSTVEVVEETVTANSVVLCMADILRTTGTGVDYSVDVYHITGETGTFEGRLEGPISGLTQSVTIDERTGKFTVKGLESNNRYVFVLKAAISGIPGLTTVNGISDFVYEADTLNPMPALENLTVMKKDTVTTSGQIAITTDGGLYINGVEYEADEFSNYPAALEEVYDLINSDNLMETDKFTYDTAANKLTVTLGNRASEREFTSLLAGKTLELTGSTMQRNITTDTSIKEVILKGEGSLFDITAVANSRIVLENGIKVFAWASETTASKNLVVAKGATVNFAKKPGINFDNKDDVIIVTAGEETKLQYTANSTADVADFLVTANNGSNDLTFKNAKGGITLKLKGNGYGATQDGTITIEATGNVTVKGDYTVGVGGVDVQSDLTVKATDGTVNVEGVELTGEKNITVTKTKDGDATVEVNARAKSTIGFALNALEIKEYDYDKDLATLQTISGLITRDERESRDNVRLLNDYLSKFGLYETGATITTLNTEGDVVANGSYVKIEFPNPVSNVEIGNII